MTRLPASETLDAAVPATPARRLDTWVFGAPAAPYRRRWLAALLYAVLFVVGAVATLYRTNPVSWNMLWAEDGKEFLLDAYTGSFLENLFHPYAGYMHLVPRLVAEPISAFVPIEWAGLWFTIAASLVWSVVALLVFDFARGHVRSTAIRVVLWAMVITIPIGGLEVSANIANSHWFLMAAAFWALAARDRGALQITVASVTVAAAALSDPLTALLLPVVLLRVLWLKTLRANIVSLVFVVAIVVQMLIVFGTSRETSEIHPGPGAMLRSFVMRVVVGGFIGRFNSDHLRNVIGNDGLYALGLALLAVLVVIVVLCLRRTAMPAIALLFAIGFTIVTTWLTWQSLARVEPDFIIFGGSRYAVTPILVLYAVVIIGADVLVRRVPSRARLATLLGVTAALALLVASWVSDFAPNYRPLMADVSTQFEQEGCAYGVARIGVLPGGAQWVTRFPCGVFDD
jgi:hypothetical protein